MAYLPDTAFLPVVQSHIEYLAAKGRACELAGRPEDLAEWQAILATVDAWESWRSSSCQPLATETREDASIEAS